MRPAATGSPPREAAGGSISHDSGGEEGEANDESGRRSSSEISLSPTETSPTVGGSGGEGRWIDYCSDEGSGSSSSSSKPSRSSALAKSTISGAVVGVGGTGGAGGDITPARRTRKRGRSLRKNVLLRTRGILMSSTNGLGVITPGMVLGGHPTTIDTNNSKPITLTSPTSPHHHHTDDEAESPTSPTAGPTTGANPTATNTLDPNKLTNGSGTATGGSSGGGGSTGYSPSPSPSSSFPTYDLPWVSPHRNSIDPLADTVWWGWTILFSTWMVFVIGMGSVLGVWEWAWDVGEHPIPTPMFLQSEAGFTDDEGLPIPGYYPALMILTIVMAWVWVVVAWVGMKYFKHAKIQPQSDDI